MHAISFATSTTSTPSTVLRSHAALRRHVVPGLALMLLTALAATPTLAAGSAATPATVASEAGCPSLLDKTFPRLQDEKPQSLCQYSGQVILVVNTASFCGFTKQYKGLEALHAKYKDRGFVVLGFPSGDFGNQEHKTGQEIAAFCANTYGVKFPMFAKSHVRGDEANALFTDLIKASGTTPKWNFYKYLVGRNGLVVDSYSSMTTPEDGDLVAEIEKQLAARK
jgi:glutathione peroxidase